MDSMDNVDISVCIAALAYIAFLIFINLRQHSKPE